MPYYSDNLDDVLAFDGIRQFSGGQASGIQSDNLAENQVQELKNMTLSPQGRVETRYGFANFSTGATTTGTTSVGGLGYYDTATYEQLLTVSSGRLFAIDNGGAATIQPTLATWSATTSTWGTTNQIWESGYLVPATNRVNMVQFNDFEYLVDGAGSLMVWNGTSVKQQGGKVRAVTVTTAGTGYTSATAVITGPDLGGDLTTLLAATAGGAVTAITVSNNSGGGYSSTPTVTIIGNGSGATATAVIGIPPVGLRILVTSGNRLFGVGSGVNRNTLYASDILDAGLWASENSIIVGGNDGEEITAVVPYYANRIIVFKPSRIYQITIPADMTSAADWVVEQVSSTTGCVAEKSAVQVNSDVFFLATDGIRSLSRSVADDFTSVGLPLSEIIKDVILKINQVQIGKSYAIFNDNRYILCVPTTASNICDSMIVYNTTLQAFEGTWSFGAVQLAQTNFGALGRRLAAKSSNGLITNYNGYKSLDLTVANDYKDSGSYYESYVSTRAFIFGDPFAGKYGSHFEVSFDKTFSEDVDVFIQRDTDSSFLAVLSNLDPSTNELLLPFVLPAVLTASAKNRVANDLRGYEKWRNLAIRVASSTGQFSLRQIIAAANPDTIEVQKSI
jgi:hypothetical protein